MGGLGYYSMAATRPMNGLRGLAGPFANLRRRIAAWSARRKAKSTVKAMNAVAAVAAMAADTDPRFMPNSMSPMAAAHTGRFMPGGTYAQVGEEYSPQFLAKSHMVAHLTRGQGGLPHNYAQSQVATSLRAWSDRWYGG
jgi:hypothetical protein